MASEKEAAYKDHLWQEHQIQFDTDCAPLMCPVCSRLWIIWANEALFAQDQRVKVPWKCAQCTGKYPSWKDYIEHRNGCRKSKKLAK